MNICLISYLIYIPFDSEFNSEENYRKSIETQENHDCCWHNWFYQYEYLAEPPWFNKNKSILYNHISESENIQRWYFHNNNNTYNVSSFVFFFVVLSLFSWSVDQNEIKLTVMDSDENVFELIVDISKIRVLLQQCDHVELCEEDLIENEDVLLALSSINVWVNFGAKKAYKHYCNEWYRALAK